MGHHHREEFNNEPPQEIDNPNKSSHPFLGANDLAFLTIIQPFLSEKGKQLVSFFINFGNDDSTDNLKDPANLLRLIAPKIENSGLKEMLPVLLTVLASKNIKEAINPTLLSSILANMGSKKEE